MKKFTVADIDDYKKKITDEQARMLIKHCNHHGVAPEICAWYDDMKDFYSDWCGKSVGYTKEQAKRVFFEGKNIGEFKVFKNGEIVRLVV